MLSLSACRAIGAALLIATLLALAVPARALDQSLALSQFHHRAWTAADGVPMETWTMAQTPDGLLWMGGPNGLTRFDGVRFERFSPARPEAFPSGTVAKVLATSNGDLWAAFFPRGLVRIRGEQVWRVPAAEAVATARIRFIAEDADGAVWAGGATELFRFDNGRWERIGASWGVEGRAIDGVVVDGRGTVWLCDNDKLLGLPQGETRFRAVGDCKEATSLQVLRGEAWLVFAGEMRKAPALSRLPIARDTRLSTRRGSSTVVDRDGNLWTVFCPAGLCRRRLPWPLEGDRVPLTGDHERYAAPEGLSGDFGMMILEDAEGSLWVATKTGLDRFRRAPLVATPMPRATSNFALAPDADGGVTVAAFSPVASTVWHLSGSASKAEPLPAPGAQITAAGRDRRGRLWLVGPAGLWRRDGARWEEIPRPSGVGERWISGIVPYGDGVMVAFQRGGVQTWEDGRWQPLALPGETSPLEASVAWADGPGKGVYWFGLKEGQVLRWSGDRVRRFPVTRPGSIGEVLHVYAGRSRPLVAGERGVAILWDGRFVPLAAEVPEALAGVSGIAETATGDLWLNGRKGAVHVRREDLRAYLNDPLQPLKIEVLDTLDGHPGGATAFWPQPSVVEGEDGRLWFAGTTGVAWLDPARLRGTPVAPVVRITGLRAHGVEYAPGAPVTLPKNTEMMELRFSAANLAMPERVRFRYRLDGIDTRWREAGVRRETGYNSLGPGSYRFHVLAINGDGVASDEEAIQDFVIPAAWYQTVVFQLLCVAAAIALIWALHRLRLKQAARRAREKMRTRMAERDRIARELHDTLLQGVQGLILRFEAHSAQLPSEHPVRAAIDADLVMADDVLDESRRRVMSLRGAAQVGTSLPRALEDIASQLARDYDGEFRLEVDGRERPLRPEVRDELRLIFGEALLNAFRHARANRITMTWRFGWWRLRIELRDDGSGMPVDLAATGKHGHMGLASMRERAQTLGATLKIESAPEKGTTVSLTMRASKAYAR
ncbi:sensor histidine kinase [Roseateles chitinivorans]|uniref:sensor histidine kinase n=1 Tax=Roseateles chitinivorans TaxID=2917965 RepID=UPI003D6761C6